MERQAGDGLFYRGQQDLTIAACMATIKELEKPGIYDQLNGLTQKVTAGILDIAKKKNMVIYCDHIGSIWQIAFGISERMKDYRDNFKVDKLKYQRLRKKCFERGIRLHPSRGRQYVSAAHTDEDIDRTLLIIEEVLAEMT